MAEKRLLPWLAAFPPMGCPGPATLSLAATGPEFGFRKGLPCPTGIMVGTSVVLTLIATGTAAVILMFQVVLQALSTVAARCLLFLSWRITTAPVCARKTSGGEAPAPLSGLLPAIASLKAFAAIGAVYVSHRLFEHNVVADTLVKLAALFPVIVVTAAVWPAFGAPLSCLFAHPVVGRAVNVCFAVLLVISIGAKELSL